MRTLYKFYKNNCGPCYMLQRTLSSVEIPEDVKIVEISVEEEVNKEFAKKHGIEIVPVLMFENGDKLQGKIRAKDLFTFLEVGGKDAVSN